MDLERFEGDVRQAVATGRYHLQRLYFDGTTEDGKMCACAVSAALHHIGRLPYPFRLGSLIPLTCEAYAATEKEVWDLISGFDSGPWPTPNPASALGARLAGEFLP